MFSGECCCRDTNIHIQQKWWGSQKKWYLAISSGQSAQILLRHISIFSGLISY